MKKTVGAYLFASLLCGLVLLSSCSKDDDGPAGPTPKRLVSKVTFDATGDPESKLEIIRKQVVELTYDAPRRVTGAKFSAVGEQTYEMWNCRLAYKAADSLYVTLSGMMAGSEPAVAGFRLNPDGTVASGKEGDTGMTCAYRDGYLYKMTVDGLTRFYVWDNGNLVFQSGGGSGADNRFYPVANTLNVDIVGLMQVTADIPAILHALGLMGLQNRDLVWTVGDRLFFEYAFGPEGEVTGGQVTMDDSGETVRIGLEYL
ncbi:MAG: hypothetical protein IJC16_04610 [Rikenellaceae bacterium]|nr:hypothetical protein [Rikenellaceae bacterium]